MRKAWFFAAIFLGQFIMQSSFALAQGDKAPKMVLKEREFDYGKVIEGKIIERTFKVLNQSDETLKILSVKPG